MAAMADRDVSETRTAIRGIVAVQNALRETQLEQGRTLEQHSQSLKSLAEVSGVLLAGQQHHGEILASLVAGVGSLEATVNSVAATVGRHDELFAEILDRLPPKPEN